MIQIGRWSGFSIDGDLSPAQRAALTQTGPYDWIHFVCLAESCLVPRGKLADEFGALGTLITGVGADAKIAAHVTELLAAKGGLARGFDAGGDGDRRPAGRVDRALVRMHADLGTNVRTTLRDAALRVALYPSLFLLAWHEVTPGLAELLWLPIGAAHAADLGLTRWSATKALPRAIAAAAKDGVTFPAVELDTSSPLAFATGFAAALEKLTWAAPTKPRARAVLIERRPLPPAVATFAEDRAKKKRPHARAFDDELRRDHDVLLARGLKLLAARATDTPEAIAEKVHRVVAAVQAGKRRITADQRAALAVVWGDQLVRALSFQWAMVVSDASSRRTARSHTSRCRSSPAKRKRVDARTPSRWSSTCCATVRRLHPGPARSRRLGDRKLCNADSQSY